MNRCLFEGLWFALESNRRSQCPYGRRAAVLAAAVPAAAAVLALPRRHRCSQRRGTLT